MNYHNNGRIWLSSPHMGGEELSFIHDAFDNNWVAPVGDNVDGFENDLSHYTGAVHTAVLSSGTAAIHLGLLLLDVKPGDVVICQSFTFSASANPITYVGAEPVFVDSEKETWNMCPDALEEAVRDQLSKGKRVKAILPVHLYGMPANMDRIMDIARRYCIPVIEDAAEALGAHIRGKQCGTFGTFGVLSFNGNKIITTSGGGALLSDDEHLIRKSRYLATQAREPAPHYQHSEVGYNYRMSNIVAGIGRGQMRVLDERIRQRRANCEFYRGLLGSIDGITFQPEPEGFHSNRWLTTILIDPEVTGITRENVRLSLAADNIESRPVWKPMHQQPVYGGAKYYGNGISCKLFEQGLCLPSGSNLSGKDRERIANVLSKTILCNV